jgi:hypothetical protein
MKKLTANAEKGIAPTLADLKELAIARWLLAPEQDKQLQLWTDAALGGKAAASVATAADDLEPAAKKKNKTGGKTTAEDKPFDSLVASYFK